jgi:hypothetical protein
MVATVLIVIIKVANYPVFWDLRDENEFAKKASILGQK